MPVSGVTTEPSVHPGEIVEIPDPLPKNAVDHRGNLEVAVTVDDNSFADRVVVISPGTTVTSTNAGRNRHNVKPAAEAPGPGWFEEITVERLDDGASASITFDAAGDFPYYCSFHGTARRGQTGRVIVVDG